MFYCIRTLALIFCSGSKHLVRVKVFLTHQGITIGNKQITNKAYDESEMRTRHKNIFSGYLDRAKLVAITVNSKTKSSSSPVQLEMLCLVY